MNLFAKSERVLIIGSGGREHALAKKIAESRGCEEIFVMPGNPGMEGIKIRVAPGDITNFPEVYQKIIENRISFVVIGPEVPLATGVVDYLEERGVKVFGPTGECAQLESSKLFSKEFMKRNHIPTAKYEKFGSFQEAKKFIDGGRFGNRMVVKASGLAAGKGVIVASNKEEAERACYDFLANDKCSVNSDEIIIEELLHGKEISAFAIVDGDRFKVIGYACDYKRVRDCDQGPNTGGMGAYTPKGWPSDKVKNSIEKNIFQQVASGMKREGRPFKGVLFAGLMIKDEKVDVIEFNVRFGDPETQVILPLLEVDLLELLLYASEGRLDEFKGNVQTKNISAVHVVMASKGYPTIHKEPMLLGEKIYNSDLVKGTEIIYSGVKKSVDGTLVNSGGRVLGVTGVGESIDMARARAYAQIRSTNFFGAHWRSDIAGV